MKKIKFTSLFMAVLMVVCVFPVVSLAAEHPLADEDSLNLSTLSSGDTVTVAANASVTISGSNSGIQISCGAGATVTLSGASINNSSVSYSPIVFGGSGNTLILASGTTNTLSGGGSPAVCVEAPAELTIDGTGELIANSGDDPSAIGSDSANACGTIHIYNATVTATNSSGGAAIGSGKNGSGGTIEIYSGTVTATNLDGWGAAIGGGEGSSGGTINIYGGTVSATCGSWGAGIGGGNGGSGGTINISGGVVVASSVNGGAAIGGGINGSGGTINISGGTVTAVLSTSGSSLYGTGIGGGRNGDGGIINISGGTVTASGEANAHDIGSGGWDGSGTAPTGGTLSLDGGVELTLNSKGTDAAVTFGDAHVTDKGLTITDGFYVNGSRFLLDAENIRDISKMSGKLVLTLTSPNFLFYGKASSDLCIEINTALTEELKLIFFNADFGCSNAAPLNIISGPNVKIELCGSSKLSGTGYAGIHCPAGQTLNISSEGDTAGSLNVTGGDNSAGIGGNNNETAGTITINSGKVTAHGGLQAAGIGGGNHGNGGAITISGGTVDATGSYGGTGSEGGAGIGGGNNGVCGTIEISDTADVTAQGGNLAAGIGGGYKAKSEGTITISGGTVTTTGGEYGAGIGSGENGDNFGTITISGGTVDATGGIQAAGIGGGWSGDNGTVAISGATDVTAQGGNMAAGIGGGCLGTTVNVTIENGTVNAKGGFFGAGIGSGAGGSAGSITISGGTVDAVGGGGSIDADDDGNVDLISGGAGIGGAAYGDDGAINISGTAVVTAKGSNFAAGIGGGGSAKYPNGTVFKNGGSGGSVSISGGTVYATRGTNAPYDIGDGDSGSGGTLSLSNMAAVFLATDSSITPTTATHNHVTYTADTEESYGFAIPGAWAPPFGAYLRVYTLAYDANGGSGTAPASVTQYLDSTAAVANGSALTRANYTFNGWNTAANGSGTGYAAGSTFAFTTNTTLYAQWSAAPVSDVTVTAVSGNSSYGSVSGGGTFPAGTNVTLTATPNAGYRFTGWYNGSVLVSTSATYSFAATENITLTAQFEAIQQPPVVQKTTYTINVVSGNTSYGSVSGGGTYMEGDSVTLTAAPNAGYQFAGWYNGSTLVSAGAVYTFPAAANVTLTAQFDKVGIPAAITATATAYNKIMVSWAAVPGARGYQIYRATSQNGVYKLMKTTSVTRFINTGVNTGTVYYYKVKAFTKSGSRKIYSSFYSPTVSAITPLAQVTGAMAVPVNPAAVKLTWGAVPGKTKYEVWRSISEQGPYTLAKITSSRVYIDYNPAPGTTYYYKIRAYRTVRGIKIYGDYSSVVSSTPMLGQVLDAKAKRISATKVNVSWKAVTGKTKYEVWVSTSENGVYSLLGETASRQYSHNDAAAGIACYYKVRAYRTVGRIKYYGGYSAVVSGTP